MASYAYDTREVRSANREREKEARAYQPLSPTAGEAMAELNKPPNAGPPTAAPGRSGVQTQTGGGGGGSKYKPTDEEVQMRAMREQAFTQLGATGLAALDEKLKRAHPMDHLAMIQAELKGSGQTLSGLPNPFLAGNFGI